MLRRWDIRLSDLVASSIEGFITAPVAILGHPFLITRLCELAGVPHYDGDDIWPRPTP
ncbi:hypothetical protein A2U01_0102200, partial [Trifolium medium]|nr:hypothetical protein [Trifolium medium]